VHKVASYSLVDGGGGVVRREVGRSGRETLASHEVGRASAMVCSLHELEWREEKWRRGLDSLDGEACKRPCPQKKKKWGV